MKYALNCVSWNGLEGILHSVPSSWKRGESHSKLLTKAILI